MTGNPATTDADREIIYIGDPMCSWCWGFAPVATRLAGRFSGAAAFRIIVGGLRPGQHAAPLDAGLKTSIRGHWVQVEAMTSQPFDYGLFDRDDFLYDTEPACKAVVCVRRIDFERTLGAFVALQRAFYAEGRDITDDAVIADVVAAEGIDRERFEAEFSAAASGQYTYADFAMASRLGARAFPTVLLRNRDDVALLTMGYQSIDALEPAVERYFSAAPPHEPAPAPPGLA